MAARRGKSQARRNDSGSLTSWQLAAQYRFAGGAEGTAWAVRGNSSSAGSDSDRVVSRVLWGTSTAVLKPGTMASSSAPAVAARLAWPHCRRDQRLLPVIPAPASARCSLELAWRSSSRRLSRRTRLLCCASCEWGDSGVVIMWIGPPARA